MKNIKITADMAETPTQKHDLFVNASMGTKGVTALPGISGKSGDDLIAAEFDYAYQVIGQFLILRKDKAKFERWLKDICKSLRPQDVNKCYQAANDWCSQYA